jgi:hypothetical protein
MYTTINNLHELYEFLRILRQCGSLQRCGIVRQCGQQCVAVRTAVCDSVLLLQVNIHKVVRNIFIYIFYSAMPFIKMKTKTKMKLN